MLINLQARLHKYTSVVVRIDGSRSRRKRTTQFLDLTLVPQLCVGSSQKVEIGPGVLLGAHELAGRHKDPVEDSSQQETSLAKKDFAMDCLACRMSKACNSFRKRRKRNVTSCYDDGRLRGTKGIHYDVAECKYCAVISRTRLHDRHARRTHSGCNVLGYILIT
jgi:hypothetical protein